MVKIEIPGDVLKKLSERAKEKGFNSTEEYIVAVLDQIASKLDKKTYSEKDEEKIKRRLKALGYMD